METLPARPCLLMSATTVYYQSIWKALWRPGIIVQAILISHVTNNFEILVLKLHICVRLSTVITKYCEAIYFPIVNNLDTRYKIFYLSFMCTITLYLFIYFFILQICFVRKFFLTHQNICKVITINYIYMYCYFYRQYIERGEGRGDAQ